MHITDIRSMLLTGPDKHGIGGQARNWSILVVRVDTDAGIYGLGEALNYMGVRQALDHIKGRLVGRDPLSIHPIAMDLIYGALPPHAMPGCPNDVPFGPIVWATGAVEMALCDLVGKALGAPAYALLGGKYRERIPIYLDRSAPSRREDLSAWKALALETAERGFQHMKFDIDYMAPELTADVWNRSVSLPQLNRIVERLSAAREAVGPDLEIAADCHRQYDVNSAIRLAQALAPLRLRWLEDPTPFVNPDALFDVREKSPIPICVGEDFIAEEFRLFIDRRACDIIHPDVLFTGGLHEARRIAEYAELHYLPMAMHNNGSALATVAACHVAAASRNFIGLEYHFHDSPWLTGLVDLGRPLFQDGHVLLDDAPGLGIVLNEKFCRPYLAAGETLF